MYAFKKLEKPEGTEKYFISENWRGYRKTEGINNGLHV